MVIEIRFDKNTYYLRGIEFTNLPLEEKLKVLYDLLYFIFENEGEEEKEIIERFSTNVGGFYSTNEYLVDILWFEEFIERRRKRVDKRIKTFVFLTDKGRGILSRGYFVLDDFRLPWVRNYLRRQLMPAIEHIGRDEVTGFLIYFHQRFKIYWLVDPKTGKIKRFEELGVSMTASVDSFGQRAGRRTHQPIMVEITAYTFVEKMGRKELEEVEGTNPEGQPVDGLLGEAIYDVMSANFPGSLADYVIKTGISYHSSDKLIEKRVFHPYKGVLEISYPYARIIIEYTHYLKATPERKKLAKERGIAPIVAYGEEYVKTREAKMDVVYDLEKGYIVSQTLPTTKRFI